MDERLVCHNRSYMHHPIRSVKWLTLPPSLLYLIVFPPADVNFDVLISLFHSFFFSSVFHFLVSYKVPLGMSNLWLGCCYKLLLVCSPPVCSVHKTRDHRISLPTISRLSSHEAGGHNKFPSPCFADLKRISSFKCFRKHHRLCLFLELS